MTNHKLRRKLEPRNKKKYEIEVISNSIIHANKYVNNLKRLHNFISLKNINNSQNTEEWVFNVVYQTQIINLFEEKISKKVIATFFLYKLCSTYNPRLYKAVRSSNNNNENYYIKIRLTHKSLNEKGRKYD